MAPIKRRSSNGKAVRKESKRSAKVISTDSSPPMKIIGFGLGLMVFLFLFVAVLFGDRSETGVNSPISAQLRKYSEIFRLECNLTKQTIAFLEVDPMADILKRHLNPIKDRISSIRAQVRIYESMSSKVPGGPTHFISTALTELIDILLKQFPKCDVELEGIISQMKINMLRENRIMRDGENNRETWTNFKKETKESLFAEGITLTTSSMDENYEADYQNYTNLTGSARQSMKNVEKVEKILKTLSGMFRQREEFEQQIYNIVRPLGYTWSTRDALYEFCQMVDDEQNNKTGLSTFVMEHKAIAQTIVEEIVKNENILEMAVVDFDQLIIWRSKLWNDLENRAKFDCAIIRLRGDITRDMINLAKRLEALKAM